MQALKPPARSPVIAAAVLFAVLASAAGTRAQPSNSQARLLLRAQPFWSEPNDRLGITLRISNDGPAALEGFYLRVFAHRRILSRSELHESFSGRHPITISGYTVPDFLNQTIPAGGSTTVRLDQPVSRLFGLVRPDEGGVYPVTISLVSSQDFKTLDSVTTDVMYYPSPLAQPLNLVLVAPLNDLASRGPDGVFRDDPVTGEIPVEEALGQSGWLTGLLDALETRWGKRLRLAVAPVPRLIEELRDMTDGYTRMHRGELERVAASSPAAQSARTSLARLRSLLQEGRIQPLLTPYDFADLPALTEHLLEADVARQISTGRAVLRAQEGLGVEFSGDWVFPPGQRLTAAALDQLRVTAGVGRHTFFQDDSLEPVDGGCPQELTTFACPVKVTTEAGTTTGYVSDRAVQARIASLESEPEKRLELQKLLAETAMIQAEFPYERGRVIQATLPSLWHPSPVLSKLLFGALSAAPWLKTMTPAEGLRDTIPARTRSIVSTSERGLNQPDASYYDTVAAAQRVIDHYRSVDPSPERLRRLRRNVLIAESRSWWVGETHLNRGESYARQARTEAQRELQKIGIIGQAGVTLSSRRGPIPLVLANNTGYPVTVQVRLDSDKLAFPQDELTRTLRKGTQPITIEAVAQASGTFPLTVTLMTPDGSLITSKRIEIRSTKFNEIALGITVGAFVFLVFFYVVRAIRRRRRHSPERTVGAADA